MYLFRTPPLGWGRKTILKRVRLAAEAARPDDTTEAFCSIPRCGSSRTPAVTCVLAPGRGPPGLRFPSPRRGDISSGVLGLDAPVRSLGLRGGGRLFSARRVSPGGGWLRACLSPPSRGV